MDRCALFVDAGYVLADGAMAVHGTRRAESVSWDYEGLLQLLSSLARERSGLPVLRCYWYEATVDGRRTAEQDALADVPGIKLRVAKIRPGRREGVETEIHRDLTTLARNNAISDALVVSAEEDLAQVIADVQDLGMRVTLVHIAVDGNWTISRALRQESDDIIEISGDHLRPYVELVAGAEPAHLDEDGDLAAVRPLANGHSTAPAASYQQAPARGNHAPRHLHRAGRGRIPAARAPAAPVDVAGTDRDRARGPADPATTGRARSGPRLPSTATRRRPPARTSRARQDIPSRQDIAVPAGHRVPPGHRVPAGAQSRAGHLRRAARQHAEPPRTGPARPAEPARPRSRRRGTRRLRPARRPGSPVSPVSPVSRRPRAPRARARPRRHSARGQSASRPAASCAAAVRAHPGAARPSTASRARARARSARGQGQAARAHARSAPYSGPQPVMNPADRPPTSPRTPPPASRCPRRCRRRTRRARSSAVRWPGTRRRCGWRRCWPASRACRRDLEARLLQGSALPIDFLLHDEVRHALRRGFWDALDADPPVSGGKRKTPGLSMASVGRVDNVVVCPANCSTPSRSTRHGRATTNGPRSG